jgi:hypothetical protein
MMNKEMDIKQVIGILEDAGDSLHYSGDYKRCKDLQKAIQWIEEQELEQWANEGGR